MFPTIRTSCVVLAVCTILSPTANPQRAPETSQQKDGRYEAENTSDGLRRLLQDMLDAARANDSARLSRLIAEMEIPNYRVWFATTYGQQKGEKLADLYGNLLRKNEKDFQEFLMQLARQDGEVVTQTVSEAVARSFKTLTPIRDFYFANWRRAETTDSKHDPIGYFMYLDGRFRWYSPVEFSRDLRPATLISRVQPIYPPEALAKGIHGRVELEVTIAKDGSVDVQKVLSGDSLLAPAAVEAVRQWSYRPLLFNGRPTPTRTTITVNFELTR